jgi:hypothetical protein
MYEETHDNVYARSKVKELYQGWESDCVNCDAQIEQVCLEQELTNRSSNEEMSLTVVLW